MLLHKNTPGIQCSELMDLRILLSMIDFKKPSQKSPNLAPKLLILNRILIFEQLFIPFVPVTKAKKKKMHNIKF